MNERTVDKLSSPLIAQSVESRAISGRFRREISSIPTGNVSKWGEGHPIANDEDGKGLFPVEKSNFYLTCLFIHNT